MKDDPPEGERYLLLSQLALLALQRGVTKEDIETEVRSGHLRVRKLKTNAAHPVLVVFESDAQAWLTGSTLPAQIARRTEEENRAFLEEWGMKDIFSD